MQGFLTASGVLKVDLGALAANYRLFQQKTGSKVDVAGVVKANAYGIGLQPVVETLLEHGCPQFFVATLEEALRFREFNKDSQIAVLGGLFTGAEETYVEHNIIPVLNSQDDIGRWKAYALKRGQDKNEKLPAFLHIDTGMNRLGLHCGEAIRLFEDTNLFDGIDVQTVMSHFVSADDWNEKISEGEAAKDLTMQQAEDFKKGVQKFKSVYGQSFSNVRFSLANSSGLFRDKDFHYDLVRPGYALYGGNPTPEISNPMQDVVSLSTRILQIRECKKGETIGYGASHKFEKDTRTATIAVGYADGFLRNHSNKGALFFNNQPCPVIGRVSMDLVTIDISQVSGKQPEQGDEIEILGPNQSVDDLAKSAGTIGYEVLTSLGARYQRQYLK